MQRVNNFEWFKRDRTMMNENRDCVVVAVATAFQVSYQEAHKFCKRKLNRPNRRGVKAFRSGSLERYLPHGSVVKTKFKDAGKKHNITVGKFCQRYPKGRFIVLVNGHALTVVDGVCHDHTDKPRRHVEVVFEVVGPLSRESIEHRRKADVAGTF